MNNDYNQAVANHYAAYRPALHKLILSRAIPDDSIYENGLDVGCGTAYSTIALGNYCAHVFGLEPSEPMLREAPRNSNTSYLQGVGEALPIVDSLIDIVTFAGSLNYIQVSPATEELKRVCRRNALVITYDFEVLLDKILGELDIHLEKSIANYDHGANFSRNAAYKEVSTQKQEVELEVSSTDLAHILLSNFERYNSFVEKYGLELPLSMLVAELNRTAQTHKLAVELYFSIYRLDFR